MIIDVLSLLDQLETLRRLDPEFRVFGASKHRYRLNAPACSKTLAEFEVRHSVSLQSDYCQYMTQVSNGGAGPNYGLIEIERAALGHIPSLPFPVHEVDSKPDGSIFEGNRIPGAIWLSDNGCCTFDILVVNGRLAGNVWTVLENDHGHCCQSFHAWYCGWLTSAIRTLEREPLLSTLRPGMHIDEIRAVFGDEIVPVADNEKSVGYIVAFCDCNAVFRFNSNDQLLDVKHHAHVICPSMNSFKGTPPC